jgi:hypothetical protein
VDSTEPIAGIPRIVVGGVFLRVDLPVIAFVHGRANFTDISSQARLFVNEEHFGLAFFAALTVAARIAIEQALMACESIALAVTRLPIEKLANLRGHGVSDKCNLIVRKLRWIEGCR